MADVSKSINILGQIDVLQLDLVSGGKVLDITNLAGDITLYEDIFSNVMSGYILLQDSLDMIDSLPMVGQEMLIMRLKTPTLDTSYEKTFYIYKLESRIIKKRTQIYKIQFTSKELILSQNSKVSKSYSGVISDTVYSIFTDPKYLGSESKIYIEPTKNSLDFISPYWTPLETINWLSCRSISEKSVPNYLFYETNQSFEYVSIGMLVTAEPKRTYIYSDVDPNTLYGGSLATDDKYSVVESLTNDVTFDYLRNLSAGMYSSKLYTLDTTTRKISSSTYDYVDNFSDTPHLNSSPMKTSDLFRKKTASIEFLNKNDYLTGEYNQYNQKNINLQRAALLEQMFAFKLNIRVHGRTDIKVGNTIKLNINSLKQITESDTESEILSDYFSGKYLITAIRHQILSGKHTMDMEIVSDSFIKKITK